MELYNDDPQYASQVDVSGFTDPAQVEVYRATTVLGKTGVGESGKLTRGIIDSVFPTSPPLTGRILRDSLSNNFRIISNTADEIIVDGTPASGQYTVLVDFPNSNEPAITGNSTGVGSGFLRDTTQSFEIGALRDRVLVDSTSQHFVIRNNGTNLLSVSGTPTAGAYTILQEFNGFISPSDTIKTPFSYTDTYLNSDEATARVGTGLEDEQFYYYTVFSQRSGGNVAESSFALVTDANSTQSAALSTISRDFQQILLDLWPNVFKLGDLTGDFEDAMAVFGYHIEAAPSTEMHYREC